MKVRFENSRLVVEVSRPGEGYEADGAMDEVGLRLLFSDLLARLGASAHLTESDIAEEDKSIFFPKRFNPRKHEPPTPEEN
jgi:hypothetical protein